MKIEITFDNRVYAIDAVKIACYRLIDRAASSIEVVDGRIICCLDFEGEMSEAAINGELNNLRKEVLDQDLRLRLKAETEPVRNLILAHAFSKTGLIADE
jgi:His-Xaa-Ser system protein HxsD